MAKCPECGSTQIEQYMMPYGPMWCLDCGFRVEEKYAESNPFLDVADEEKDAQPRLPLGAALYEMTGAEKKDQESPPPEESENPSDNSGAADDPSEEP